MGLRDGCGEWVELVRVLGVGSGEREVAYLAELLSSMIL